MEIEIRTEMNRAILTLKGDLTKARDLAALQGTVNDLLGKGVRDFTLNLDAVQYVDSAGLEQLVRLYSAVKHTGGDLKTSGLTKRMRSRVRLTKLREGRESENFMELPDPLGTGLPMLNPVIWLVLLITFAILVTIASRVAFSVW